MKKQKKITKFIDSDADGLSDDLEKKLGTNPYEKDSDNDGIDDFEEVNVFGTDPLDADTDGDGMSDGDEVKVGRNPRGMGLLKDAFIPHEGNNYHPHALHLKRIFFYGITATIMKFIVVVFILVLPMEAWLTPDLLLEQSRKIIELTNKIRANLKISIVKENKALNQAAFNKAQDMMINQYFAHVGPEDKQVSDWLREVKYNYSVAGENLAMGFNGAEDVVDAWTKSKTHYANLVDKDYSEIGVGMYSGLYNNYDTTMVSQFFGKPKIVQTAVINKVEPVAVKIPEKIASTTSQVLSVKSETIYLSKPEIISPENNFLTNKKEVALSVYAPNAEKIIVYNNDKLIYETNKIFSEPKKSFSVSLEEGVNKLKISAGLKNEIKFSDEYAVNVDTLPPVVDQSKSKIYVSEPINDDSKVVKAEAFLSADTAKANVFFDGNYINLTRDEENFNKWTGQMIMFDKNKDSGPVVLPNLIVTDSAGSTATMDIGWENIMPTKPSLLNQYFFLRSHQSSLTKSLFSFTSIYYKILLAVAIISLILNIFIQIKKQHPHVILSSFGLIFLLIILIYI